MQIRTVEEKAAFVLSLSGRLDSHTSPDLEAFLAKEPSQQKQAILLELTELDYISSAGLRLILNLSKLLKRKGVVFALCGMQEHIREIFEISGFDTFLAIYPSRREALRHLQA